MLISWSQYLSGLPDIPFPISSKILWYSKYIKIPDTTIHFAKSSNKTFNLLSQLFENVRIISGSNLKKNIHVFSVGSILKMEKLIIRYSDIYGSNVYQNHHTTKELVFCPSKNNFQSKYISSSKHY